MSSLAALAETGITAPGGTLALLMLATLAVESVACALLTRSAGQCSRSGLSTSSRSPRP